MFRSWKLSDGTQHASLLDFTLEFPRSGKGSEEWTALAIQSIYKADLLQVDFQKSKTCSLTPASQNQYDEAILSDGTHTGRNPRPYNAMLPSAESWVHCIKLWLRSVALLRKYTASSAFRRLSEGEEGTQGGSGSVLTPSQTASRKQQPELFSPSSLTHPLLEACLCFSQSYYHTCVQGGHLVPTGPSGSGFPNVHQGLWTYLIPAQNRKPSTEHGNYLCFISHFNEVTPEETATETRRKSNNIKKKNKKKTKI